MTKIFFIGILFVSVNLSGSTKCFLCDHVQYPYACETVTTCGPDEICFIQEVVTQTGNVAFNSGCMPNTRCTNASVTYVGKRSGHSVRDSYDDITACTECCQGDYCNMKGCNAPEIPTDQRGLYCFACDNGNPENCTNVNMCQKGELCFLYTSVGKTYKSQCQTQALCDLLSHGLSKICDPVCCKTDFCNDQCRHA
ncbi:uncharacterized protein LOC132715545 [Ruditapes philippinarum]|uniref:uncharacterized protein LOC132715545 n=1 Tax=Ruditapes philippinarum TaxID=129788 RepID=UPI00295BF017|nr:uncharacterized protein LOC132715545 [Ruditapes philippinarum]